MPKTSVLAPVAGRGVLLADVPDPVFSAGMVGYGAAIDPPLRTREELHYFRIWKQHLDGVRPERTVARFATA